MPKPLRRPLLTALVALLLGIHAWIAWSATLRKGPAFDESAHLVAGYAYWKFDDYRLQPENGNLPQRLAGLAQLPLSPHLDPAAGAKFWIAADVWKIAQKFLYETGNLPEVLLAAARGAMTLVGVACGLLVFFWSRRLWGDAGGLFSLALCAGSATMLANGPMITSDTAAAFCLLAATGAYWRYLEKPGAGRLALSLLLTGLAAIAKFSFLLLLPTYALLTVWHLVASPRTGSPGVALRPVIARLAGITVAHFAAAAFVIWAAFGFRYSAAGADMPPVPDFYIPWDQLLPAAGLRREALLALKRFHLLPEAYTHGLAYVLHASEARGAFAAGQYSSTGWWWFFPYAFLVKSTIAELLAVAGLAALALRRWLGGSEKGRRIACDLYKIAPLLALSVVYGGVSLSSNLNIGHRHILPLYLPLFIVAGALARLSAGRLARLAPLFLVLTLGIETWRAYPNHLAYFNPIAGPAGQRWHHLVDSSLDWGQELPALADWLHENQHADEPVYLSYFGVADPRHEGIKVRQFAPYFTLWEDLRLARLEPGLFCISATLLQDCYSPFKGLWDQEKETRFRMLARYYAETPAQFAPAGGLVRRSGTTEEHLRWLYERLRFARLINYLRVRKPDAVINSAILVYRLDAREVAVAVDASAREMSVLIENALADENAGARR